VVELLVIAWLRFHYFRMPLVRSTIQVIVAARSSSPVAS